MPQHSRPRARQQPGRGVLLDRARRWSDAHVTFERTTDVTGRCPHCDGLLTRRLDPGVLCGTCGRLWMVREMLQREAGLPNAV
jgi:hypothetical protein